MVPTGACVVVIVIAPLVRQRSWVLPGAAVVVLVSPVCEWFSCASVCTTVLTIAALTLLK